MIFLFIFPIQKVNSVYRIYAKEMWTIVFIQDHKTIIRRLKHNITMSSKCGRLFAWLHDFFYNKKSFEMISVWSFTETEYRLDVEGSIELVWKSLCGESSPIVSSPVMELQDPCHGAVISQSNNEGKVHYNNNKIMSFLSGWLLL